MYHRYCSRRGVNILYPNTIGYNLLPIIRTVCNNVSNIPTFVVIDMYHIVGHHSSNTKRTSSVRDDHYMDVHSLFVVIKMSAGYARDEHPDVGGRLFIITHRCCVKILLFFVSTTPTCRADNGTCSRHNNG